MVPVALTKKSTLKSENPTTKISLRQSFKLNKSFQKHFQAYSYVWCLDADVAYIM